jgi:Mga helix-turn-helix domain
MNDIPESVATQVRDFLATLQDSFYLEVDSSTISTLQSNLHRVGSENREDLLSTIFLECAEVWQKHGHLNNELLRRIVDRVRHRLVREARRQPLGQESILDAISEMAPEDETEFVIRQFLELLKARSALDVLLFQKFFLENQKEIAALSNEFGLSTATIYRKLQAIQNEYLALRDLRQPPHAAD